MAAQCLSPAEKAHIDKIFRALDVNGHVLATVTRFTSGSPAALALRVDVPSKLTGTGEALVLDGHDGGMIRAAILDPAGQV